jgi:hypothetical protein
MDLTAQDTSWIWGYKSGDPLKTDDITAFIAEHDDDGYGVLTFDVSARGGPGGDSSTHPFLNSADSTDTNTTPPATVVTSTGPRNSKKLLAAHAALACVAWAFMFPLGGILIRAFSFPHLLWVHAALQVLGLFVYIIAVGLGLRLALGSDHMQDYHVIIGLSLFVVFLFQPLSGYMHHVFFKKYMSRTMWSFMHLWAGRVCITLGIVNGWFGFQLTGKGFETWNLVVYMSGAGFMWVVYVASAVVGEMKRKKRMSQVWEMQKMGERSGSDDKIVETHEEGRVV